METIDTPFDSLFNKMAMAKSKEELQNVAREVEAADKKWRFTRWTSWLT